MDHSDFNTIGLSEQLLKAIDRIGYQTATPIQSESIEPILQGRDVIAQAPTGTGKTGAFGIPLIEKVDTENPVIQALVLCPTRELALQTAGEMRRLAHFKPGVRVAAVYGGQQIERQIADLKKRPQILVATPGRMMDHMRRRTAKIEMLKYVVLDEADEMLSMGFREDICTILEKTPKDRQTVLFSATLPAEIMRIAKTYQKDAVVIKVAKPELKIPQIEQYVVAVRNKNKPEKIMEIIRANNYKLCLVFCNTKRQVDELAQQLKAAHMSAEALHGDMKQFQRDKVMRAFRNGNVRVLVATDVAARGIDVEGIEAVFNYDIPQDIEYYIHRIGRTGRADKRGTAYTFAFGKEMARISAIMKYTKTQIVPYKEK